MAVRIALLIALVLALTLWVVNESKPLASEIPSISAQSPSPVRPAPPPPMFSGGYGDALRDVMDLEPADVVRLERKLEADPKDFATRLKLMAYYQRADRSGKMVDRAQRVRHTLWLIEHYPHSEILHSFASRSLRTDFTDLEYRRVVDLWATTSNAQAKNAEVQWNAASFFHELDPELYLYYLEATAAADPNHPFALRPLAHLYAQLILNEGTQAQRAHAALENSKNVWVLGNAANMLQSMYNHSLQMRAPNDRAATFAEHYFDLARAIDPSPDRKAILPKLDLQDLARAEQLAAEKQKDFIMRFDKAASEIELLAVGDFPEIPPAVAGVLRARNCKVPQASERSTAHNVIRGEFIGKGENGWALLCSVNGTSSILVFRNDRDTKPHTLATTEDRKHLQGLGRDKVGYSRAIGATGRDTILRHYRAYGGPEPPIIDHQGIDDAFVGKASVTWYFYEGKWLQLQGAD